MTDAVLEKLATQGIMGLFCVLFLLTIGYLARALFQLHNKRFEDIQALAEKAEAREELRKAAIADNTAVMRELATTVKTMNDTLATVRFATEQNTSATGSMRDAMIKGRSTDRMQAVRGAGG